jgi:hypothetical protein
VTPGDVVTIVVTALAIGLALGTAFEIAKAR